MTFSFGNENDLDNIPPIGDNNAGGEVVEG